MVLIGLLLIVEGLSTGLWIARILQMLSALGWLVILLAVLRGLTGGVQLMGGMSLFTVRPSVRLSQISLVASAALTTLEIGVRLTPNNLDPTWRWPLVVLYWAYALGASAWIEKK